MKTKVLKVMFFTVIFIVLFEIISSILILKGGEYGSDVWSFYNEDKNSLNLIYFGSSQSYSSFSPYIIDDITGLKSYNFATQQQPINITYYYMKEALKYQKPKYMVIESRMFYVNTDYAEEGVVRTALDRMKFSKNKIDAINSSVEHWQDRLSYYINIIKYHSRYKEINMNDIKMGLSKRGVNNKGYIELKANDTIIVNNDSKSLDENIGSISNKNQFYLDKMIELAKNNDIELIFVKTPNLLNEDEQPYYNYVAKYIKEKGYDFIDYNKQLEELNLDYGDFYDYLHLSKTGSEKISKSFANYLLSK